MSGTMLPPHAIKIVRVFLCFTLMVRNIRSWNQFPDNLFPNVLPSYLFGHGIGIVSEPRCWTPELRDLSF